jgi:hypothetical protein
MVFLCSPWRSPFPDISFQKTGSRGTSSFSTIIRMPHCILIKDEEAKLMLSAIQNVDCETMLQQVLFLHIRPRTHPGLH